MDAYFRSLSGLEIFFVICALFGGIFFLVRLAMQFVGLGDGDFDDGGGDIHDASFDDHHVDSDVGFKILTVQGLTSFFMMFGLVGLALYREIGTGAILSIAGATAAGLATVWVIGKIFSSMRKLQSSGTVGYASAVGGEGTVYLTIPAGGSGKVQVSFRNRFREYDAVAADKGEIKTGERIRVTGAEGGTLIVEKIP